MNRYYTIVVLILFTASTAVAQGGRSAATSRNKAGLTIHVFDESNGRIHFPGAEVILVMGRDTVTMNTNHHGEAHYSGRFRTDSVVVTVRHPGYASQQLKRVAPAVGAAAGTHIYLKEKQPTEPIANDTLQLIMYRGGSLHRNAEQTY